MKKYTKIIGIFLLVSLILLPTLVSAQSAGYCPPSSGTTLCELIDLIITYLQRILILMMGVAIVMFVFYVIKYFFRPDADRKEAGTYVMYSLIGFFIILSFWGLVNILQNTFGLQNENNQPSSWYSFTNLFPKNTGGSGNMQGF